MRVCPSRSALVLLSLVAAPGIAAEPPAPAQAAPAAAKPVKLASFEEAREGAEPASDLVPLLEPLYAECPKAPAAGDLAARQCETIRAWHLERLQGRKYSVVGDSSSLQPQPYDAAEKSISLTVTGCLHCASPLMIAGGPRILVTRPPQALERGVPVGIDLTFHEVKIPDPVSAKRWQSRTLPKLRVEYVFTAPSVFAVGGVQGVKVNLLAHRVYNRCTGEIIGAEPPPLAKSLPPDPTCPPEGPTEEEIAAERERALLPETLTPAEIARAMAPAQERAAECASAFELKGTAQVKFVIYGNGAPPEWKIAPPYDSGEANICIRNGLKLLKFPKFRAPQMKIDYPFPLNP